ncbi:hypothetical protein GYMLUDRAFT_574122 [Collybiopsis luxurians FD-317 M1]|uniref:DNA polymerase delta subunit 3 n=1 Tax=Collybiopsis luxurians FD-317 M1 TaxID=944289 RepID=A0A0D0C0J9_9AGAR|nr:hypothetical protein GYMLUDRAFT_574122 [Collybiopsis luxurians FD-317 M1]
MSSQKVDDFLTKQVLIEGNIVTYRSLSRQLSMHVNAAKNALYSFYSKTVLDGQSTLTATYLITGQVELGTGSQVQGSDSMDVDNDNSREVKELEYENDGHEDVEMTEIVLVDEKDLENTKSKFSTISCIHVYSLSPAPIRDLGLICGPNEIVREVDNKKPEMTEIVGKIVGNIKEMKGKYIPPPPPPAAAASTVATDSSSNSETATAGNTLKKSASMSEKEKPKPKDFFANMKSKEKGPKELKESTRKEQPIKKEESKSRTETKPKPSSKDGSEAEAKSTKIRTTTSSKKKIGPRSESEDEKDSKRGASASSKGRAKAPANKAGTKRKSGVLTESEEEEEEDEKEEKKPIRRKSGVLSESEDEQVEKEEKKPDAKSKVHVRRGVVISDDEEEESKANKSKSKGKSRQEQVIRDEDEDVLGLMEIDDEHVDVVPSRASRSTSRRESPESSQVESEHHGEDVEMEDDTKPPPKPKKTTTKAKKVIPVGKNGLKKKRVVKKREFLDPKGYIGQNPSSGLVPSAELQYSQLRKTLVIMSLSTKRRPRQKRRLRKGRGKGRNKRIKRLKLLLQRRRKLQSRR